MFYSETNRPKTIAMPKSSQYETEYIEEVDKDGKKHLKEVGKTNVYEKIQASLEATKVENIIKRYTMNPANVELLNRRVAIYADISDVPENMIDAYNTIEQAKDHFAGEDTKIKEAFNNSFTEYLAGAMNGKLAEVLGLNKKVETAPAVETTPAKEITNE